MARRHRGRRKRSVRLDDTTDAVIRTVAARLGTTVAAVLRSLADGFAERLIATGRGRRQVAAPEPVAIDSRSGEDAGR